MKLPEISLPKGFVEWAQRTGNAEAIARGDMDIIEALREWNNQKKLRREF